jgi:benzoate membrane transport protein
MIQIELQIEYIDPIRLEAYTAMNSHNVLTGLISAAMAFTGGAILVIASAVNAGFERPEMLSWLFSVYFFGGLLCLGLALWYRIPFAGAHSITAAAYLSTLGPQFSLEQMVGGYIISGILIAVFGFSGLFGKVLDWIPKPLIDAMLAGLVLSYVVKIVPALGDSPIVGALAILGFFLIPRIFRWVPPILGVLVFAVLGLILSYDFPAIHPGSFQAPQLVAPEFTWAGLLSIAIPVAVLILSNDLAVGLASLKNNGYEPPVNKTIALSGLATACVGFFGGHAVSVGGMMSALCSSEEAGPKSKRYWAAVVSSVLVAIFGLLAWIMVEIITALPNAFVTLIVGFSLLGVLVGSLKSAFSAPSYRYSVMFTFVISISNVAFLGVAAPVWALLIGGLTAKWLGEGKPEAVTADN